MNKIGLEKNKINLVIKIIKMPLKSLTSNTSWVVWRVPAELLKSGTENFLWVMKTNF